MALSKDKKREIVAQLAEALGSSKMTVVAKYQGTTVKALQQLRRDARGNGTASAIVTGTLTADGPDKTSVKMVTDMTITGKPAQFGRGVINDVANKIIGQFAACVAEKLTAEEAPAEEAPAAAEAKEEAPAAPASTIPAPRDQTATATRRNLSRATWLFAQIWSAT